MSDCCKIVVSCWGANSASPTLLAGVEGALRGGRKRGEREGNERKSLKGEEERDKGTAENIAVEINFRLWPLPVAIHV